MAENDNENVKVLFFGFTRDMAGTAALEIPAHGIGRLADIQKLVHQRFPSIEAQAASIRWAVNCEYSDADTAVAAGAEVALIPPVAGG